MSEQEYEQQIAKAFNAGLQMQKHEPALLDAILKSDSQKSDFLKAMVSGKKQAELEKILKEQQKIRERQKQRKPKR